MYLGMAVGATTDTSESGFSFITPVQSVAIQAPAPVSEYLPSTAPPPPVPPTDPFQFIDDQDISAESTGSVVMASVSNSSVSENSGGMSGNGVNLVDGLSSLNVSESAGGSVGFDISMTHGNSFAVNGGMGMGVIGGAGGLDAQALAAQNAQMQMQMQQMQQMMMMQQQQMQMRGGMGQPMYPQQQQQPQQSLGSQMMTVGGMPVGIGPGPMGSISTIRTNIPNIDEANGSSSGFSFLNSNGAKSSAGDSFSFVNDAMKASASKK